MGFFFIGMVNDERWEMGVDVWGGTYISRLCEILDIGAEKQGETTKDK